MSLFFSNSHSLFSDILAFAFLHVFFIVFVFSIFAMTFMTLSQNFRLSPTLLAKRRVFGPLLRQGRGRGRGGGTKCPQVSRTRSFGDDYYYDYFVDDVYGG